MINSLARRVKQRRLAAKCPKILEFTRGDIAEARGVKVRTVYKAIVNGRLDPRNLASIASYVFQKSLGPTLKEHGKQERKKERERLSGELNKKVFKKMEKKCQKCYMTRYGFKTIKTANKLAKR